LEKLHGMFDGDWLLAVAAYNCGEGAVERSIRKNQARDKPTDFWSLALPRETRQYVPNLIAVSKIVAEPEKHEAKLSYISNRPYLQNVNVGTQINLNLAARLAGLSTHEFNRLNPGYRLGVTDPDGPHLLTLPIDKVDDFKQKLTAIPVETLLSGITQPKPKLEPIQEDSEETASTDTDVAVAETTVVARAEVSKPEREYVAAPRRFVPPPRMAKLSQPAAPKLLEPKKKSTTHTVKNGDTLWTIARNYKVSVEELTRLNGLQKKGKGLQFGKKLAIPGGDS